MPFTRIQSSAELSLAWQLRQSTIVRSRKGHQRNWPKEVQLGHLDTLSNRLYRTDGVTDDDSSTFPLC